MIIFEVSQFDWTDQQRTPGCSMWQMLYFKSTALSKRNLLCQVFVVVFVVSFFFFQRVDLFHVAWFNAAFKSSW